jgi:hypothetical protein
MDSTKSKLAVKEINYVHEGIKYEHKIRGERKYENRNMKTQYTFSPFTCKLSLT